ncbi:hypothetical protein CMUS01_06444 [Colletotrichum musicola]|uniref:Uncharacterized protein n=1 Tax=Colletotrichum musicola TaxID=2175873 RepID=A0A8H6KLY4_9PEZI|nr:hypothetical protein CMUS01_06444 [Colletotrichum musicola]
MRAVIEALRSAKLTEAKLRAAEDVGVKWQYGPETSTDVEHERKEDYDFDDRMDELDRIAPEANLALPSGLCF